ncbi:MAG: hypothetical protein IPK89_15570 [Sphingomonadales bacterium]|nr:hypothetical protein [Sphingomonadales bacterium]
MLLVRKYIRAAIVVAAVAVLASCGGGSAAGGGGGGSSSSSSGGSNPPGNVTSRISIDGTRAGQTLSGWEVTARFWEFDKANDRYDASWLTSRDTIIQRLIDDAGITRVRVQVRSGTENPVDYWSQFVAGQIGYNADRSHYYEKINDNTDPAVANPAGFQWSAFDYYIQNFVLPMKSQLAARNKTLFVNLCFVDFNTTQFKGTLSLSGSPNEYAELMTMAAMRLRDRFGINVDALEIILEPDNGDGWNGAAVGRAIVAAKSRLAAAGINPKIIAPSTSAAGSTTGFLDGIATISGASSAINTVSYHRYDGAAADQALATIRQRASALGADTAMLEYDQATIQNFFKDMAFGGATAWQAYAAAQKGEAAAASGYGAVLWQSPGGTLALTNQFSQIGLIQRNVVPGARAHAVTSQLGSDLSLDFRNPDGSEVIAVYSPGGSTIEISGAGHTAFSATFAGPNGAAYTTSTVNANGSGLIIVTIPANTVVVLHSTN